MLLKSVESLQLILLSISGVSVASNTVTVVSLPLNDECTFHMFLMVGFRPSGYLDSASQYTLSNLRVGPPSPYLKAFKFAGKNVQNAFGTYFVDKTECSDRTIYCIALLLQKRMRKRTKPCKNAHCASIFAGFKCFPIHKNGNIFFQ